MPANIVSLICALALAVTPSTPAPVGRLIDLGGHHLHLHCTGRGRPIVVVETGLGDFSFDWVLVQRRVQPLTRICTYDRGGYAWSDPGPAPRTFDQLNLELHDALAKAGELGPYVLVGHSFGGGVVRAYAHRYPDEVAGLVFVDIVSEDQYIPMGPRHAGRIRDDAKGRVIPEPRESMPPQDVPAPAAAAGLPLGPPYDRLPAREQRLHAWAAALPSLEEAEASQKEWSAEYFAKWAAAGGKDSLGARPLVVLTRAHGGYGNDLDVPGAELERVRLESQRALAALSTAGTQQIVASGHNMHLEAPDAVRDAIHTVVAAVRKRPGKT